MDSLHNTPQNVLYTERLILRLIDPEDPSDCEKIVRVYTDPYASLGGQARVGINSVADLLQKCKVHGPKAQLCTLAPPPRGLFHLVYLPPDSAAGRNEEVHIGMICLSFRQEMPYPDLGYSIFEPYVHKGYASEAGRAALQFWRDQIGVREIFAGALEHNQKSQQCAEGIGFVRGGGFDVIFGSGANERKVSAVAMILPGMEWKEWKDDGSRTTIRPTIGVETEAQERDPLDVGKRLS